MSFIENTRFNDEEKKMKIERSYFSVDYVTCISYALTLEYSFCISYDFQNFPFAKFSITF